LRAVAVEQEARAAGNRRPGDRAQQVPDQRTAHARIEHDRHGPALHPPRIDAGHRAQARLAADQGRIGQVSGKARAAPRMVALERAVFPAITLAEMLWLVAA
jgi:hypothetical protein